jgi:hypothetical protein
MKVAWRKLYTPDIEELESAVSKILFVGLMTSNFAMKNWDFASPKEKHFRNLMKKASRHLLAVDSCFSDALDVAKDIVAETKAKKREV